MKPVIAITPEAMRTEGSGRLAAYCEVAYTDAVTAAGGVPLILPLTRDPVVLDHLLQTSQGLLLTGGGDMAEAFYTPAPTAAERATLHEVERTRDDMELYLVGRALTTDFPLLGICRGIQVLNVAAGGTLLPDIALRRPGALPHRPRGPELFAHAVHWEPEMKLTEIHCPGCDQVNSVHHQAVDRVAPGWVVAARAPDGIVEAMEKPGARFPGGVQFHPERLWREAPQFLRLFEVFVKECAK